MLLKHTFSRIPIIAALLFASAATACGSSTELATPSAKPEAGAGGAGDSAGGAPAEGGAGGGGAIGGGGSAGASAAGGAGGGGAPDPIGCATCVAQNCPEVLACAQDAVCGPGLACTLVQCVAGGSPDPACVLGCFNGDASAALAALQALACVATSCSEACAGILPTPPP